jgi:hypothetical protein
MREKRIPGMMVVKGAVMDRQTIMPRKIWKKWKTMEMSPTLCPR